MKNTTPLILAKPFFGLLFFATIFVSTSCNRNMVYDRSLEISETGWHEDSAKTFDDVIIHDSLSPFDFYINLRHSTNYRYSNFYFFLNTTLPNGHMSRDTIELILADNTGKWYGNGSGHIRDNRILIREKLKFPLTGNYQFTINQAMREDDGILEGIINVGIRIEKSGEGME
ncbi:MAG: hypothetical protein B6D64_03085 [Bacteroidetes bacterium 4484_276]|nr:MAG: hypothetical protein B6D64_03085 [Bacteroidetes bacterium 4484_276]OYT13366.1 MAG: hypothetical protein B6I19_05550 [Bacteroidetes bacterium 4572_114]